MLDAVDLYVLVKVATMGDRRDWSQGVLAADIGVSASTVNRALKRGVAATLYRQDQKTVNVNTLVEALVHGARYYLVPKLGGEVRGTPTAWAAPPLNGEITSSEPLPPVWPHPLGSVRGLSVEPLHPNAPTVALRDPTFYAALALVDALRLGGVRERNLAQRELRRILRARVAKDNESAISD